MAFQALKVFGTFEKWAPGQVGIQTHDLQILVTLALPAELQGQNGSRPWVLEILFHSIEASNEEIHIEINVGCVALTLE